MSNQIYVLDDVITNQQSDFISQEVKNSIRWAYVRDVTYSHEEKLRHKRPAFGHRLYVKGEVSQPFNVVLYPMILQVFNTIGYNVVDVLHGKALIQLPLNPEFMGNSEPDLLHVDMNQKHVVFLYYVDDSDGDTIIVDKKYEGYKIGRAHV